MKARWDPIIFKANDLVTSPSQLETHATCPRKRWWEKVRRMPTPTGPQQQFGLTLHSCAERWLSADDVGRVPPLVPDCLEGQRPGDPVDAFPPGWDKSLGQGESSKIRRLVESAISSGVLRRLIGRVIEEAFLFQLLPRVALIGVMDQHVPGLIEDHKTTKSRRWAMGPKRLATDGKMLAYAAHDILTYGLDRVTLRLNYFSKDPNDWPSVWHVDAVVREAAVRDWLEGAVVAACEMLDLQEKGYLDQQWSEVEGPRAADACRQYGGCPMANVCGGLESPSTYRGRV